MVVITTAVAVAIEVYVRTMSYAQSFHSIAVALEKRESITLPTKRHLGQSCKTSADAQPWTADFPVTSASRVTHELLRLCAFSFCETGFSGRT
jgi:hypothetical protein